MTWRSLTSTVTASSAYAGLPATNAADGSLGTEWASNGQLALAGAWILLSWGASQTIGRIVLRDRPNPTDVINAGTLSFSDGSTVATGALPNDGSLKGLTFPTRSVTWAKFTVDSAGGANSGLLEFEAYAQ